jgi:hypothetical protein
MRGRLQRLQIKRPWTTVRPNGLQKDEPLYPYSSKFTN